MERSLGREVLELDEGGREDLSEGGHELVEEGNVLLEWSSRLTKQRQVQRPFVGTNFGKGRNSQIGVRGR